MVKYQDDDDVATRRAWNVGKHDEECNTTRWSSVAMKVQIAKDMYGKLGDWTRARKALNAGFNSSLSTVQRSARAALGLDPEVLAELALAELETVPGEAMWDNEYLMGSGP